MLSRSIEAVTSTAVQSFNWARNESLRALPLPTRVEPGAAEVLQGYSFSPPDLEVARRRPGISAFMRIRNGQDFLESTILSHLDCFDEVVAVYNQCTDATPAILLRLQQAYPHKLRVIHYVDRVFPPGSQGHAVTPPDSPASMVNYSNAALAATRCSIAIKLDDDHLAIAGSTHQLTDRLRSPSAPEAMHCFSGLNLIRAADGRLGVLASTPISGGGDIGLFPVRPDTYFVHDRRFERFQRGSLKRLFSGFLYWHLKYLKAERGFANYELDANPNSRFARRLAELAENRHEVIGLEGLIRRLVPTPLERLAARLSSKQRLKLARDAAVASAFPDASLVEAVRRTVDPAYHSVVL